MCLAGQPQVLRQAHPRCLPSYIGRTPGFVLLVDPKARRRPAGQMPVRRVVVLAERAIIRRTEANCRILARWTGIVGQRTHAHQWRADGNWRAKPAVEEAVRLAG